jgi:DNA-binding HxlR family transcriptional regulator
VGASYHQFCPVAKAMELLDERWTMLVVRELLCGSRHFNDLRRGLPTMSPSLLSKRLQTLVRAGVVCRRDDGPVVSYQLTSAGEELRPVVETLGAWGMRWIGELGDADLDPKLLLWDLHRNVEQALLPQTRTVIAFTFHDLPPRRRDWWMVLTLDDVDVCDVDPGYEVGVRISGSLRRMVEVWRGDLDWPAALRTGSVRVEGPEPLRRAVPRWFPPSRYAAVPRSLSTASGRTS